MRRPIEILLVEDNSADIRLTEEAFRDGRLANRFRVVRDGVEALAYLAGEGAATRPDLILLDLNLPRLSGLEVLKRLKADPSLRRIPVIVLTTSDTECDLAAAYDLQASSVITKPVDFDAFLEVVRAIEHYWLTIVAFPER